MITPWHPYESLIAMFAAVVLLLAGSLFGGAILAVAHFCWTQQVRRWRAHRIRRENAELFAADYGLSERRRLLRQLQQHDREYRDAQFRRGVNKQRPVA